jgi:hypothetical protein
VTEYADPDLETVAPLPPADVTASASSTSRSPIAAVVAALVVVSLVVGFAIATIALNATDSSSGDTATGPRATTPAAPGPGGSGSTPTTPPVVPIDQDEAVLGQLILRQSDVAPGSTVQLLDHGADLSVATLDLCNGTFPTESQRTARRQVGLSDAQTQSTLRMSTEAILYRVPSVGVQALRELHDVAEKCPSTPVKSPVGETTQTTTFRPAPDGAWPRTANVERRAYDFVSVDADSGRSSHSIAVYLRRGRALMGIYFSNPDSAQTAVDGRTTIPDIVHGFESRMAKLPNAVVTRGG